MQLHGAWTRFRDKHPQLTGIDNPYNQLSTPTEFMDGRWIQFSESDEGLNGMDDAQLEKAFADAFSWAMENGIKKIITTGIRDIPFDQPEEPRVAFIKEVCSRDEYNQLEITLISRDTSYVDGTGRNIYSRHFLPEPDIDDLAVELKVSEKENEPYYSDKIQSNEIEPLKEFYMVATPQPSQMLYVVSQMQKTLHGLLDGDIPNETAYTISDLKNYCQSLVARQHDFPRSPMANHWSVVENIRDIPRALKDRCLYFPSIIAVATLSHILINFPEIALKTDGFGMAMRRGFSSCLINRILGTRLPNLYNDRYFTNDYFLESIELLSKSGSFEVLNEYPDYSHEKMKIVLEELKIRLAMDLDCGYIERETSSDYADKCRVSLELLSREKT